MKPKLLVPSTVLLLGGALVAVTVAHRPTVVSPTCSLEVPSRVAVTEPALTPLHRLRPDCKAASVIEAAWTVELSDGTVIEKSYFNFDYPAEWYVFDRGTRGVRYWRPAGARKADDPPAGSVAQNSPITDVRLGSAAELIARRAGKRVTLDLTATHYDPATHQFQPWPGATGRLELRTPGTEVWYPFREVTMDASGRSSEIVVFSAKRDYRMKLVDTADTWGSDSPVVRKV
jgi:hypothetical protein